MSKLPKINEDLLAQFQNFQKTNLPLTKFFRLTYDNPVEHIFQQRVSYYLKRFLNQNKKEQNYQYIKMS